MKVPRRPIHAITSWVRRQPSKMKAFFAMVSGLISLVLLYVMVHDHNKLFVAVKVVHAIGIAVLIYKLMKERSCAAARLYCSFVIEYDVHTFLDLATLIATLWVIYMIRFKLKASYMGDKDNFKVLYVVVPCILLSIFINPRALRVSNLQIVFWAFCVYLEAVSVLPQLQVMQNIKIVEPFTVHYVFALGVSRFLNCAHWILQIVAIRGGLPVTLKTGFWPRMVLLAEIVQTFVLANFCYYYVKSSFHAVVAVVFSVASLTYASLLE